MNGNLKIMHRALSLVAASAVVIAMTALGPAPLALAEANANPGVIPPGASPYGHSYGEWAGKWWQWVFSIPTPVNPLFDETRAECAQGQSGPVWYLAGTIGGSASRNCTVPAGKALLFPIINQECSTVEGNGTTEAELRACAASVMDLVTQAEASVDGVPLTGLLSNYRFSSPLYTFTLPADNLLGQPEGTSSPSIADGFYVMLAPLPAGEHTVHFLGAGPFGVEVTYHLTVR